MYTITYICITVKHWVKLLKYNCYHCLASDEEFKPLDFNDDRDERMTERDKDLKTRGDMVLEQRNTRPRIKKYWKLNVYNWL